MTSRTELAPFLDVLEHGRAQRPHHRIETVDVETPLSVYLKLARGAGSFLFESVEGGERWGRYSLVGLPARHRLELDRGRLRLLDAADRVLAERESRSPFEDLRALRAALARPHPPGAPRFSGGLVGQLSYETVGLIEPRLDLPPHPDPIGLPLWQLLVAEEVAVFDALRGELHLISHREDGAERLDRMRGRLRQPVEPPPPLDGSAEVEFQGPVRPERFCADVERVQSLILEGDCMQVVLSQRRSAPFRGDPLDLYRALRHGNPSPYLFFLDLGAAQIAGSSPETLVRVESDRVTVRPIAGTRPRGADPASDAALERELLSDEKELAEHLMLIDLGRNDVGRVSETGSVEVEPRMVVERYSHVMHIVSEVNGRLKPELDAIDALAACFPAGTLSGAPKVRAMEIIHELEPERRGVYAGAVGYLDWSGDLDTAIAIRTAVIKDGEVHVQAGAGVVADSDPESEWLETLHKGRAVCRAAGVARAMDAESEDGP